MLIPQRPGDHDETFSRDLLASTSGPFGPALGFSRVGGPVLAAKILPRDDGDQSTVIVGWGSAACLL